MAEIPNVHHYIASPFRFKGIYGVKKTPVSLFEQNFFKVYKKWCFHEEHGEENDWGFLLPFYHISPDSSLQDRSYTWARFLVVATTTIIVLITIVAAATAAKFLSVPTILGAFHVLSDTVLISSKVWLTVYKSGKWGPRGLSIYVCLHRSLVGRLEFKTRFFWLQNILFKYTCYLQNSCSGCIPYTFAEVTCLGVWVLV